MVRPVSNPLSGPDLQPEPVQWGSRGERLVCKGRGDGGGGGGGGGIGVKSGKEDPGVHGEGGKGGEGGRKWEEREVHEGKKRKSITGHLIKHKSKGQTPCRSHAGPSLVEG